MPRCEIFPTPTPLFTAANIAAAHQRARWARIDVGKCRQASVAAEHPPAARIVAHGIAETSVVDIRCRRIADSVNQTAASGSKGVSNGEWDLLRRGASQELHFETRSFSRGPPDISSPPDDLRTSACSRPDVTPPTTCLLPNRSSPVARLAAFTPASPVVAWQSALALRGATPDEIALFEVANASEPARLEVDRPVFRAHSAETFLSPKTNASTAPSVLGELSPPKQSRVSARVGNRRTQISTQDHR